MRRIKTWLKGPKRYLVIALTVLTIAPAATIGDDFFEISKNLEIFSDLYKNINLYYADETRPGSLMKTGIDAMLNSLDPYTTYIPESKMEDYRFMTTGQYGGIGSLIRTIDGQVYISEPYEGFPAHKNGLQAGDRLIRIDGEEVQDKSQEEISEALKGSPGSKVEIEVLRYDEEPMTFDVEREEIKIPDVPYSGLIAEKTGYIKLNGFTRTASKEVREAFSALEEQGMEKVVLDLRGNGGGLLQEAVNIVNFFVPRGTEVVSTKGKIEQWDRVHKALNEPLTLDMPVAVLIDGNSASASEIVSGTLQDLDRAIVVGETSFGKGLVQQTKDIAYGSKLKITVAKYYTPSGRCIQKLDYFHKVDGQVAAVPDSLIKEFRTKNGRPVFDGKGISPDVEVDNELMGKVIGGLFRGNYFFKYANVYARSHDAITEADAFKLSDEEYDEFIAWMADKELEYTTETQNRLEQLVEKAKEEKYYSDAAEMLETLSTELNPDPQEDLMRFKDQVKYILESEIIARYHFQDGRIIHGLNDDPVIESALENLDQEKYSSILAG
ncbi:MAG: S41 family peptidase [Flavobacteriales bacterium]|nr:S41 family peptidase [Flavobacteriales bacterium]